MTQNTHFFYKTLRWGLSTESFLIFWFSIVMEIIAYCISIVIGWKVSYKKVSYKNWCVLR